MNSRYLTVGLLVLLSGEAAATEIPVSGGKDSRMRTVTYDRRQVVRLSTTVGTALVITFSPNEKITAVAVTDSKNLTVSPKDNFLFLKSRSVLPSQPVVVLTAGSNGARRYVFELEAITAARQAAERRDIYYSVEFRYPGDEALARSAARRKLEQEQEVRRARAATARAHAMMEQAKQAKPSRASNWRYVARGSRSLTPSEVFDNGYSTFFRFPGNMRMPAIFRINPDGREAAVNATARGDYVVVSAVAPAWRLRDGKATLRVWNRAYDRVGRSPGTGTTSTAVRRVIKEHAR